MTNKYEMLKKYVHEKARLWKDDESIQDIQDLIKQLDKAEPDEEQDGKMLTVDEWNALGYKERMGLKETDRELFDNSMAHKFKEAK